MTLTGKGLQPLTRIAPILFPGEYSSGNYASLSAAVTAIGATVGTLIISTANFPNGATCTVPVTLTLKFIGAGSLLITTGQTVTIASDGSQWPVKTIFNNALPGVSQIETATVLGGTPQVETATVVGTITTTGNATVIVTAAGMTGTPKTISVGVILNDTASQVAAKIRASLAVDTDVTALFTVGGSGTSVVLTRVTSAANDATLNIDIANGTCAGLTAAPTSANTTAGVAAITSAGNATVIVTAAGMTGTPKTLNVAVALNDTNYLVAGKIRTDLAADTDVSAMFDTSGSSAEVILTRKIKAANDATLNINIANGTCAGLTAAPTSTNTTAGAAPQGIISFSGNKTLANFYTEWWGGGVGVADSSQAMQACIDAIVSMGGGGTIQFAGGTYTFLSMVIHGNQLSGISGPNFTMISLQGQGVSKTSLTWGGSTSGTMLKFWRNKYANISQVTFINNVARGTTIGLHLTGPASGLQTNNLNFNNCDFQGFGTGILGGGGPLTTEAAGELDLTNCNFTLNGVGFQAAGTGNTLDIWFRGCAFIQNTSYGLLYGTGSNIHIYGGISNANGIATFAFFGGWTFSPIISGVRFELTPPEIAIIGGTPTGLKVESCTFQTTTGVVPAYPVIQAAGLATLQNNQFGAGSDTGWITYKQNHIWGITMINNTIFGTVPFFIPTDDSNSNGSRYTLINNIYGGAFQPNRQGIIVWPDMVDDEVRGSATFASAATKAVTITTRESALYDVLIEKAVNEDIWVTSKATTGFTLNSSNATSTAVINYVIRRQ